MKVKFNQLIPSSLAPSYSYERSVAAYTKDIKDAYPEGEYPQCSDGASFFDERNELTPSAHAEICLADAEKVGHLVNALSTGVYEPDPRRNIVDVMYSQTYPEIFNAAVELFVRERVYPQSAISDNLFTRIPYSGNIMNVTLRTIGGVAMEEVPEGSKYPEQSTAVRDQGYMIHMTIKKYGALIGGTRELIASDNWGILGATLAQMKNEERMLRERIALNVLNNEAGFTIMDNFAPSNSQLGTTTGRGWGGTQNGALGMDDMFEIVGFMSMRNYNIDTIIMHPFAWMMWQRDPEWRENLMNNAPIIVPNGSAAQGWGAPFGSYGPDFSKYGAGFANGQNGSSTGPGLGNITSLAPKLGVGSTYNFPNLAALGSTFFVTPKAAPPLKIITSPLVRFFRTSGNTNTSINGKFITDIIFADSTKCGVWLENEALTMESWTEQEREIEFFKFRTRFGKALMEQGRAVCIAKNVTVDRTYMYESIHTMTSLPEVGRASDIRGLSVSE